METADCKFLAGQDKNPAFAKAYHHNSGGFS
jgi:hypothetical protein